MGSDTPPADRWYLQPWAIRLSIALAPLILLAPSLGYGPIGFDDEMYWSNPALHGGGWYGLVEPWTGPFMSDYFPLTQITIWLDLVLFGKDAWWGPRLHSFLWYAVGTWGLYAVARRLIRHEGASYAVALVYALHPVGAMSVLWLAERKNLLCLACLFWSVHAYLSAIDENDERPPARRWSIFAVLAVAAFLTKAHAVVLPVLLAAYELFLGRRPWAARAVTLAGPVCLAGLYVVGNFLFLRADVRPTLLGGSLAAALASDGVILWRYFAHTVYPFGLSLFYGVDIYGWGSGLTWLAWGGVAAVGAAGWAVAQRKRLFVFLYIAGLGALIPALNLLPVGLAMADHYHHYALAWWLMAWAVLITDTLERLPSPSRRRIGLVATSALVALMSLGSALRLDEFSSFRRVLDRAIAHHPDNALAWSNLARLLATSSDPQERELAGQAALHALQSTNADRIMPWPRVASVIQAGLWLHRNGRGEEAVNLVEAESARFSEQARPMRDLVRAEFAARTGRPDQAIEALTGLFDADLQAVAQNLRARGARRGEVMPPSIEPLVARTRTVHDRFNELWQRSVFRRQMLVLAEAHRQRGDLEAAFDVAAAMVNLEPDFRSGYLMLAQIYRDLGLAPAAQTLLDSAPASNQDLL